MKDTFHLNEEDIRPRISANYNRDYLYYKDITLFLDKFKREFQLVDCVACNSKSHRSAIEKDGFSFRLCDECATLFISPRPSVDALSWWYTNSEHVIHSQTILTKTVNKRKFLYDKRVRNLFNRTSNDPQSLLEIGCGTGSFLSSVKKFKPEVEVQGIDLCPNAVQIAQNNGFACLNISAEKFSNEYDKCFDLILAFEVLEHIQNPLSLLKNIANLLNQGGTIYMTMPNYLSYDFLQVGDIYRNLFGPDHLNYFNTNSIVKLLESAGFNCVRTFCDGVLDVSIVDGYHRDKKKVLEGFWKYTYDNKEKHSDFFDDFQYLLQKHKLSGNMTVMASRL